MGSSPVLEVCVQLTVVRSNYNPPNYNLYKLKFYGISDKALQLHQSYLGNRYCRTAIYNDNENSNKVSEWAKVRHGVPGGPILGPRLLFYI